MAKGQQRSNREAKKPKKKKIKVIAAAPSQKGAARLAASRHRCTAADLVPRSSLHGQDVRPD
jgi:RNase P/RNase MRP subunit p30